MRVGQTEGYLFGAERLLVLQFADIPVHVDQTQVDDADILTDSLDILQVPEGKSIIVPIGKKDALRQAALEQVVGGIPRHPVFRPIMREVIRLEHSSRNQDATESEYRCGHRHE